MLAFTVPCRELGAQLFGRSRAPSSWAAQLEMGARYEGDEPRSVDLGRKIANLGECRLPAPQRVVLRTRAPGADPRFADYDQGAADVVVLLPDGRVRSLLTPTKPDTLVVEVDSARCGSDGVELQLGYRGAHVRYRAYVDGGQNLELLGAVDRSGGGTLAIGAVDMKLGHLGASIGDHVTTMAALLACQVVRYRQQCTVMGIGDAEAMRRYAERGKEMVAARDDSLEAAQASERVAEAAATDSARHAAWRAGPSTAVTASVCNSGRGVPSSRLLSQEARQVLILQPEASTKAQLRRMVEANSGKCLAIVGRTDMPTLISPETAPRWMDIVTDARKYRVHFEEGQYRELLAWIQVARCNEDARVQVTGEFAGLEQASDAIGQPQGEYIVTLSPARLVALEDWHGQRMVRREVWTRKSDAQLDKEASACLEHQ